jgi:pimeloyl-ACP methyl ester carboxylesterase
MAEDAIAFIEALGFAQVDLFGFSLGGFIAQVIAQTRPELVRKIVLAGTGPAGGVGISDVGAILQGAFQKAGAEHKHPKHFLFFSPSHQSQKAADAFLRRLGERQTDRDTAVSDQAVQAQLTAITKWGQAQNASERLKQVRHPVLIANGDADVMVPTPNSIALFGAFPMRSSASSRMRATAASSSMPMPSSIRHSAFLRNSDALRDPDSSRGERPPLPFARNGGNCNRHPSTGVQTQRR